MKAIRLTKDQVTAKTENHTYLTLESMKWGHTRIINGHVLTRWSATKAGNENKTCPTCGRSPYAPFRVYEGVKVTAGCVDAIRTGHKVELKNYRLHENGNTLVSWS